MTLLFLFLSLLPQETETIKKAHKGPYVNAVKDYRQASEILEEGVISEAIEILDGILSDRDVKKRECILKIEMSGGDSDFENFFPYQLRGRCYLAQAKKTIENETARRYLERAKSDFEKSVELGLPSSRKYLETVNERWNALKESTPPPKDPEPEFKATCNRLLSEQRFQDAKKWIESEGSFLTAKKRSTYLANTQKECHTWVTSRCQNFLQSLENAPKPEQITALGSVDFKRTFALPSPNQLLSTPPSYKWCTAVYKTLLDLRAGKDVSQKLLDHAVAALPLVSKGENGWYRWAEGTAYSIVESKLKQNSEEARDAPRKKRETLQNESRALEGQWSQFETKVNESPSFRARNLKSLIQFPKEYPGMETLPLTLENALAQKGFKSAILEFEQSLRNPGENLTLESRQEILRYRIVAGALLRLYEKKSEAQAAEELKDWGSQLKSLGGSFEMTGFGSRVEEVFTRLGRNP